MIRRRIHLNTATGGPAFADAFTFGVKLADSTAAPTDAGIFALALLQADAVAAPTEAVSLGFPAPNFGDSSATPADTRTSVLTRWATTNSTTGTAPTNPTNAQGSNDGTVATVKAAGVLPVVPSTLNLQVVQPLDGASNTPVAIAHYNNIAGLADTFTNQVSYRRSGDASNTVLTFPTGNFLVDGTTLALTSIDTSITVVFTFTHNCLVAATGGSTTVDAVGIRSINAL